jgi:plasmid stabilization system protein ParE
VTREVRFLDEAVAELHDAAAWYQERSEGLGLVFLSVIDSAVDLISRLPGSGALVEGVPDDLEVRRTTIARFPYYIAYLAADDDLMLLAVAHERLQPKYWIDRAER